MSQQQEKVSLASPLPQPLPLQSTDSQQPLPADFVPLPSKGRIYGIDHPLHEAQTVEITGMTTREEDILTSRALLKAGKAIDTLLKSCIVDKRVDPGQMVAGDKNAILVAIRITGYGAEYEVKVECPNCEEKCDHTFMLDQLPIKPLGAEPLAEGVNLFSFKLPLSQKDAQFKILTGAEEAELATTLERARKTLGSDAAERVVSTRLLHNIVSVDGETDRRKIAQIVSKLRAGDSHAFRKYVEKIAPGIDMVQQFECPKCEHVSEVDVPMGTEFFWPST